MKLLKEIARAILPGEVFEKLRAERSRRFQLRQLKRAGLLESAARYVERNGRTVLYGPFAGTEYPLESALSRHSIPKLLGIYEEELHWVVSEVAQRKYDVIIDIGSAEGYYAVGLARLLKTKVLAYDPESIERGYCESAARLNHVADLVEMRDLFHASDIEQFKGHRVLCVCDCEGYEEVLFNAETLPLVTQWDILIELHGTAVSKLTSLNWPHETVIIDSAARKNTYKEVEGLGDPNKLLSEYRSGPQKWLWCDSQHHV